jgi:hypothetical protein
MAKKKAGQPPSPNILDYPDSMSLYERESLAAEAKLAAERKIRKRAKPSSDSKCPLPNPTCWKPCGEVS